MTTILTFPLLDSGLTRTLRSRAEVVALMTDDLVRLDAFGNEADAIRALMWCERYSSYEVMVNVDDARQAAHQQAIVAREMSKP